MRSRTFSTLALVTALTVVANATAQDGESKPVPCSSKQHRAFDFWIGEWDVTAPAREGWRARSSISLGNNSCSLHEDYSSPGGYAGRSINFYDAKKNTWHQTWIDNQGAPLYLEGEPTDQGMTLSDGTNRITWTLLPDGRVRQHWQVNQGEGANWSTAFDGYYQRRNDSP